MMKIFANTIGLGGDKNEGVELLVNLKDCAGSIGSYVVSLVQLRDGNTKIVNRPLIELERVTEAISLLRDSLSGRDQATGATNSWSPEHAGLEILSPRERDVCRLLLSGKSAAEIADKLYISIHTARNHRKAIYRKLGVSSQIELIQTISPP
jgi:DNA-binding CsgD family transcriptional regulator